MQKFIEQKLLEKIRRKVLERLPENVKRPLVKGKKHFRSYTYRLSQWTNPITVTRKDLVSAFSKLGLSSGDRIFFQSSMSAFGKIEGGARTVIEALREVIGQDGLIVMPAFPMEGSSLEYVKSNPVFDLVNTPSKMGKISEVFRQMEGVYRSLHPTHSVCAFGRGARDFVEGHEKAETPFGKGSPFEKIIQMDFWQVWFGIKVFTLYHAFEDLFPGEFPLKTYLDQEFEVRCIQSDGSSTSVKTKVHDPKLAIYRTDHNPSKRKEFFNYLLTPQIVRKEIVGKGEILTAKVRDLMKRAEELFRQGITIYDIRIQPNEREINL